MTLQQHRLLALAVSPGKLGVLSSQEPLALARRWEMLAHL